MKIILKKLLTRLVLCSILFSVYALAKYRSAYANEDMPDILSNDNLVKYSRIKDISHFEGIRDNILIGYGLVVGLNKTGDNLRNSGFTEKELQKYLERLGVNMNGTSLKTNNTAAVVVTATLPPFARQGNTIDVKVSTLGDAKSLQGGTLLATSLIGADGKIYSIAQGKVLLNENDPSNKLTNNFVVPTSGYVFKGGIVEREIKFNLNDLEQIQISLKNPDITTAKNVADSINSHLRSLPEDTPLAYAQDSGTIIVSIPTKYDNNIVQLLAKIENIPVSIAKVAKIVIDQSSSTIVMNSEVTIDDIAISYGNLNIIIDASLAEQIGPRAVEEELDKGRGTKLQILNRKNNLQDLITGLNSLKLNTRDLINILQSIQNLGALNAEIEIY